MGRKRYIDSGQVDSVTSFFSVPKEEEDIRMVYNATSSGLNDAVWCPWFALPTVKTNLRAVEDGTFMADCDVGEMFLNVLLHDKIRRLARSFTHLSVLLAENCWNDRPGY